MTADTRMLWRSPTPWPRRLVVHTGGTGRSAPEMPACSEMRSWSRFGVHGTDAPATRMTADCIPGEPLFQLGRVALHPAVQGRVVGLDAALTRHLFEIAIPEPKWERRNSCAGSSIPCSSATHQSRLDRRQPREQPASYRSRLSPRVAARRNRRQPSSVRGRSSDANRWRTLPWRRSIGDSRPSNS